MKARFYFLTWACCIVFNALLFAIVSAARFSIIVGHLITWDYMADLPGRICTVGLFSIVFSAPGLLLLVVSAHLSDYFLRPGQRFWFMVAFCWLGTFLSYCLLFAILGTGLSYELLNYIPVSLVAVLVALLATRKLFYKAFMPGYKNQTA